MCINLQSKVFIACSLAFLLLAARMCGAEARVSKRKGSRETRVEPTVGSTEAKARVEQSEQSGDLSLG